MIYLITQSDEDGQPTTLHVVMYYSLAIVLSLNNQRQSCDVQVDFLFTATHLCTKDKKGFRWTNRHLRELQSPMWPNF